MTALVPDECFDPDGKVGCFRCDPIVAVAPATRALEDVAAAYAEHATAAGHRTDVCLCVLSASGVIHAWMPEAAP